MRIYVVVEQTIQQPGVVTNRNTIRNILVTTDLNEALDFLKSNFYPFANSLAIEEWDNGRMLRVVNPLSKDIATKEVNA